MNTRILLILKYLWEQSDESHTVSIADLSKYLSENGTMDAEMRKLFDL